VVHAGPSLQLKPSLIDIVLKPVMVMSESLLKIYYHAVDSPVVLDVMVVILQLLGVIGLDLV
jgi:uncharacterized membrane protein